MIGRRVKEQYAVDRKHGRPNRAAADSARLYSRSPDLPSLAVPQRCVGLLRVGVPGRRSSTGKPLQVLLIGIVAVILSLLIVSTMLIGSGAEQ